jgi:archaellum component FlaF (FlaF/FlaG flagellin family)
MTGCGVTYNTVAQTYHVTLNATANGSTVQTASFDVVLKQKAGPW